MKRIIFCLLALAPVLSFQAFAGWNEVVAQCDMPGASESIEENGFSFTFIRYADCCYSVIGKTGNKSIVADSLDVKVTYLDESGFRGMFGDVFSESDGGGEVFHGMHVSEMVSAQVYEIHGLDDAPEFAMLVIVVFDGAGETLKKLMIFDGTVIECATTFVAKDT